MAAAAHRSLQLVQAEPQLRERLLANIQRFRAGAAQRGLPIGESATAIQPMVIGDEPRTLALSSALFEAGYWVAAIRPPTVPVGTARLRLTLCAAHTPAQIEGLLEALGTAWRRCQSRAAAA